MQQLQLYIEGTRVELFKDENVSLTQTIQNVKDIKKIFTEFTQSFSVPASKTNNKLFKHFYNIDIDNGFDSRRKKNATIELNGVSFKVGKIKLNGVNLKNNLAHTYRITFFGNTVDIKDILGDDQLSSLGGLGVYNQLYTYDEVLDGLDNYMSESSNNVLVPLITHSDRMFYDSRLSKTDYTNVYYNTNFRYEDNGINWNQFKYALRVQTIIDAIQAEYTEIQFSNDFFNDVTNDEFNNLFLWLHRKKGMVESPSNVAGFVQTQVNDLDTNTSSGGQGFQPIMNSSYGIMTIGNTEPDTHWTLDLYLTPQASQLSVPYSVTVTRNNTVYSYASQAGAKIISLPDDESGTYTISIGSSTPITFAAGNIFWYANIEQRGDDGSSTITGFQKLTNTLLFITTSDLEFNIIEQIPKMTIMQFLTGLFQMFNLTAYVDETGLIIIKTLDSYYADNTNNPINIDQYIDVNSSVIDAALPFKEVTFSYKGLGTLLAKKYEQIWNGGWGSERFTLNDEIYDAPSESYAIELPFEHMMYERIINDENNNNTSIQYGYFVDDNFEPYFGEPLLFYPIRQTSGDEIAIRSTVEPTTRVAISNYFIPSNSVALNPLTSKSNIHFNVMINEWTTTSEFTDTLFETKYKTYIQDVFSPKRRLTKVTAYLPMKILINLKLNDIIELGQSNYLINSLKTNLNTGKTQFELLNTVI
tara:strand:- start:1655 stop:3751 length:2097 start_codon:yes stop_codon:yes gene_type:complete